MNIILFSLSRLFALFVSFESFRSQWVFYSLRFPSLSVYGNFHTGLSLKRTHYVHTHRHTHTKVFVPICAANINRKFALFVACNSVAQWPHTQINHGIMQLTVVYRNFTVNRKRERERVIGG